MSDFDVRVPPHDTEAEQSCLGACLIDPEALEIVADLVQPQDMYHERHARILEVMLAIRPHPVDLVTVSGELRRRGWLDQVGGLTYLTALADAVPTTANVGVYAERVAHLARCRRAQQRFRRIIEDLYSATPEQLEDLQFAAAIAIEDSPSAGFADVRLLGEVAAERLEAMRQRKPGELLGTTWGFRALDYATPGLEPRGLYIIAGRPGMGKTGFGLDVARRNAMATRRPWLFVTYEMALEALADRQITALARMDSAAYRRGYIRDWRPAEVAVMHLKDVPLYATADCITVQDIRRRARWLQEKHGAIGGVMVDYLQLVGGNRRRGQSREEFVAEVSRSLKQLARELECPVVALSQLNRAVEAREDKRPQLSDLRESGAIEQDAEAVLMLYRQDYYDLMAGREREAPGIVEVIIAKQRNMPVGTVKLHYQAEWGLFTDLEQRMDREAV